jgi:hypothetical protein
MRDTKRWIKMTEGDARKYVLDQGGRARVAGYEDDGLTFPEQLPRKPSAFFGPIVVSNDFIRGDRYGCSISDRARNSDQSPFLE